MGRDTASRNLRNLLNSGEYFASISAKSDATAVASAIPLLISGADVMAISAYIFACIKFGVSRSEIISDCELSPLATEVSANSSAVSIASAIATVNSSAVVGSSRDNLGHADQSSNHAESNANDIGAHQSSALASGTFCWYVIMRSFHFSARFDDV